MSQQPRRRRERREGAPPPSAHARAWHPAWGLLVVVAYKTALALAMAEHPLVQPVGDLDSGEYWRLAQRVAGGDVLLSGTPLSVSPLYIYVLALFQTLSGGSLPGVLLWQALVGTVAVGVAAWTASRWGGRRAGMAAAALLALTGVVALQEAVILQSAIDPVLMTLCLAAFTLALQRGGGRAWALCGLALAGVALNRPNAWTLLPLIGVAALWTGRPQPRAAAALVVGIVVGLAPFTLRTALATGEWQVLPAHGGLNLYIGNHAGATGTYTVLEDVRPSIAGQRDDMRRVAEAAEGRPLTDAEVSRHFLGRALAWWRAAPVDAMRLTAWKALLAVHAWELPVNVSYAWFRHEVWLLLLLPVGTWLLVPLTALSLGLGSVGVEPARRDGWHWFRWTPVAYLAGVIATFVVDRYRAPGLVMAAVVCAPTVATLVTSAGAVRRVPRLQMAGAVVAAVGLGLLSLVPLPFHLGEGDADVQMALHAIEQGRDDEAETWLVRAMHRHPDPALVSFRAGLAWQARADWPRSETALREAHRRDPEVAEAAFALAGSLLSQGKGAEAVPLLRQASEAGVHPARVRLDLALALWQAGRTAEARRLLEAGVPREGLPLLRARALAAVEVRQVALATWLLSVYEAAAPGDAEVLEKLGLMHASAQRWMAAAAAFEAAAARDAGRATARFNLALVRLQQGRRDEAIALLREALRIDPGYAQAAGALREIQQ